MLVITFVLQNTDLMKMADARRWNVVKCTELGLVRGFPPLLDGTRDSSSGETSLCNARVDV